MSTYDYDREKKEAINAGRKALQSLRSASREINSAKNWGFLDILGGGLIITMIKRSKMSNARSYMEQAKYDLKNFCKELNDVQSGPEFNFDISSLLHFADYFFDDIFSDLLVQNQIMKTSKQIDDAIRGVECALDCLENH